MIDIKDETSPKKSHRLYLPAEIILRYLIANEDKTETMILCKSDDTELVTSDQSVYEALGSIKPYDDFKLPKLTKMFEVVDIVSYKGISPYLKKRILKEEVRIYERTNNLRKPHKRRNSSN